MKNFFSPGQIRHEDQFDGTARALARAQPGRVRRLVVVVVSRPEDVEPGVRLEASLHWRISREAARGKCLRQWHTLGKEPWLKGKALHS